MWRERVGVSDPTAFSFLHVWSAAGFYAGVDQVASIDQRSKLWYSIADDLRTPDNRTPVASAIRTTRADAQHRNGDGHFFTIFKNECQWKF